MAVWCLTRLLAELLMYISGCTAGGSSAAVPCRGVRLQLRLQTQAGSGPGRVCERVPTGCQPSCGPVTKEN